MFLTGIECRRANFFGLSVNCFGDSRSKDDILRRLYGEPSVGIASLTGNECRRSANGADTFKSGALPLRLAFGALYTLFWLLGGIEAMLCRLSGGRIGVEATRRIAMGSNEGTASPDMDKLSVSSSAVCLIDFESRGDTSEKEELRARKCETSTRGSD